MASNSWFFISAITMTLLLALLCFYTGHVLFKILSTLIKRKQLKTGDVCSVYIGENRVKGLVLKVNSDVDIWVIDRVIRFSRDQVYA